MPWPGKDGVGLSSCSHCYCFQRGRALPIRRQRAYEVSLFQMSAVSRELGVDRKVPGGRLGSLSPWERPVDMEGYVRGALLLGRHPVERVRAVEAGEPAIDEVHSDRHAEPFTTIVPHGARLTGRGGIAEVDRRHPALMHEEFQGLGFTLVVKAHQPASPATLPR